MKTFFVGFCGFIMDKTAKTYYDIFDFGASSESALVRGETNNNNW